MDIVAIRTIKEFLKYHAEAEIPFMAWYKKIKSGKYKTPQEIIIDFKGSDFVGDNRIVFNIAKNKYRLIVSFDFYRNAGFVKFVGTHREYDKIDAKTVEHKKFTS